MRILLIVLSFLLFLLAGWLQLSALGLSGESDQSSESIVRNAALSLALPNKNKTELIQFRTEAFEDVLENENVVSFGSINVCMNGMKQWIASDEIDKEHRKCRQVETKMLIGIS